MSGEGDRFKELIYHVEICRNSESRVPKADIVFNVQRFLDNSSSLLTGDLYLTEFNDAYLREHVNMIAISDTKLSQHETLDLSAATLHYHVYHLQEEGPGMEQLEEDLAAASHWLLPSKEFDGMWESLVFDEDIKTKVY